MATGLGFAPETPAASPGATARAPRLDVLGETRQPPVINARENPIAAIGAMLQNFGRGIEGKELYTTELRKERLQREALEFEKLNLGSNALAKGMELLKNTPAAQREAMATKFGAMYEHILPGFSDTLREASQQPEATAEQIRALGDHGETLIAVAGDIDGALKLATNPAFMKQLDDMADQRNAPEIFSAMKRGQETLMQTPEGKALWEQAMKGGFTLADLQDPALQEGLGITQSHVNTIARSKEVQSSLREFGFKPVADMDAEAAAKAKEKPLSRIGAEAAAAESAKQSAKIVNYIGQDGTIKAATLGEREKMAAMGFQPFVSGRTEQDLTAQEQAREKDAAGKSVPVDPYFARIAGVPPTMTKQEAIDKGLVPDIDEPTKRQLQGAEAAARGISGLIGQARAIVEQNPDANTRVAALGGLVTNFKSELDAFGRATGVKIDVDREMKGREDIFKQNGIDNALMKQLAISLAYMNAKSLDDSGRLSDSDVRNSAKALGAGASNPEILANLLDQAEMTADDSFRNRVESATGARRPSNLPDIQSAEDIASRITSGEKVTADEIATLPPRARRALKARLANAKK